jgi:hypothetical protein
MIQTGGRINALVGAINVLKSLAVGSRLRELRTTLKKLPIPSCKNEETTNPA